MRKVLMLPTRGQALNDQSNSINQIVLRLADHLPQFGYELTDNPSEADLVAGHAGQTHTNLPVDVALCHGLYPTAYPGADPWHNSANQSVINNLITAKAVIVPSEWVADILRRDMHINPVVLPWAIDFDQWGPGDNQGYVLWNKTRTDQVCDPTPIVELAKRVPAAHFVTTYGNGNGAPPNLRIIGRQTYDAMKPIIQNAGVYLATTKETGGIGIIEAMACAIPVLGYRHGNIVNLVKHGINGYLVDPGDLDGLIEGLAYCQRWRDQLGANGRQMASVFNWDNVAHMLADVFDSVLNAAAEERPKVSVVVPCHNYGQYVAQAINSVAMQLTGFDTELIVVDDGSTDNSADKANQAIAALDNPRLTARVHQQANAGVAAARNVGINQAKGEYIVCLDADDMLGDPKFLQTLSDALDADRGLGIVFTGLQTIDDQGNRGAVSNWPNGYNFERQLEGGNQVPTCCMFRREAWRRAGGYRPQYTPAEDAELWTRIAGIGYRTRQAVDAPWFLYRVHGGSLSDDVRQGKRPEPDWRTDKPWVNDKHYPLAANGVARPVRNYDRPKVSIIVPVAAYHVPYLGQALDSIERQTERFWECIVVNDTGADLPGLAPYPWAKVTNTPGGLGAGAARNIGAQLATAPLLTFLDADDLLLPKFLELTLRKYQQCGRYIYTDWLSLNKEGQIEPHQTPEFVTGDVFRKPVQHAVNILMRRSWFEQIGGFDKTMDSWEDVDFFMRLGKANICGARVPEPLFIYRYTTGQRRENGEQKKAEIIGYLNEHYDEYIRGTMACSCSGSTPQQVTVSSGGGAIATIAADSLVRVVYNGPLGQHSLGFGKTSYGYRKGGDVFYVRAEHVTQYPELFTPIAEVVEEKVSTPIPPPPPRLTLNEAV